MLQINYYNKITFHHEQEHDHIRPQKFQNYIFLTSKSAFIFAMLYSYIWLVLCAVYTKILNKNTYTDKLRDIMFIIKCDSSEIMNAILSVIYGSVYAAPSESKWWRPQNRLYWWDVHDNHMQFIGQP